MGNIRRQVYALGEELQAGSTLCKWLRNHAIRILTCYKLCIALCKQMIWKQVHKVCLLENRFFVMCATSILICYKLHITLHKQAKAGKVIGLLGQMLCHGLL